MKHLAIVLLFVGGTASAEIDICKGQYFDAVKVKRGGFLSGDFPLTLAIKDRLGFYFPFRSTGCYDLSGYRNRIGAGEPVEIFINNTSEEQRRTYFSSTIYNVDVASIEAGSPTPDYKATFRRNEADDWMQLPAETWLSGREDNYESIEGTIKTNNVDRIFFAGGYQSKPVEIKSFPDGLTSLPLDGQPMALWHALLAKRLEVQRRAFHVFEDTTENASATMSLGFDPFKPHHRVTIRNDLIAFNQTPAPSLKRPILTMNRRSCIYMSYRIGGEYDFPLAMEISPMLPNVIVIRLKGDADC